jgi:hypothetical protein
MKLSKIAFASALALTSVGSFAQVINCDKTRMTTDKADFVTNCVPSVRLYIAGASALKAAVEATTRDSLFESTPIDVLDHSNSAGDTPNNGTGKV